MRLLLLVLAKIIKFFPIVACGRTKPQASVRVSVLMWDHYNPT